jgi:hypothetical protein
MFDFLEIQKCTLYFRHGCLFSTWMFCPKFLHDVLELPSPRNTKKNWGKPDVGVSHLFSTRISTRIFNKTIFVVFLNSPYRETPKKNKSVGGWVGPGFSKCTGGSVDLCFCCPLTKPGPPRPNIHCGHRKREERHFWLLAHKTPFRRQDFSADIIDIMAVVRWCSGVYKVRFNHNFVYIVVDLYLVTG